MSALLLHLVDAEGAGTAPEWRRRLTDLADKTLQCASSILEIHKVGLYMPSPRGLRQPLLSLHHRPLPTARIAICPIPTILPLGPTTYARTIRAPFTHPQFPHHSRMPTKCLFADTRCPDLPKHHLIMGLGVRILAARLNHDAVGFDAWDREMNSLYVDPPRIEQYAKDLDQVSRCIPVEEAHPRTCIA